MAKQREDFPQGVALVIGGSGGMGRTICEHLAEAGSDVALTYHSNAGRAAEAVAAVEALGRRGLALQLALENEAGIRAAVDGLAARADAGDTGADWVAQICLLKNHATQTMQFCADQAVQILGGMGFMRGTASERIYREVKVMMIGGGTEEIMKELASRQLGI